jgi:glycosyltransferase involved in cell wall biosynthesis
MSSGKAESQPPSSSPDSLSPNGAFTFSEQAQEDTGKAPPEVSVVMPCLNEGDTIATCIEKAHQAFRDHGISGEIVIADNGSTDDSQEIAARTRVVLVHVGDRGYGNALMGGIARARGRFIIMGDADDSYDFCEVPRFVFELRKGYELVQGCRFPSGGGTILPGAMPFHHRWWGNPMLSYLVRRMFRAPIRDVYCGMRGFTKALYDRLDLRATGMEFATEMIIKASLRGERMTEVPITLHPDGRKAHPPHLRTIRDGWRTLRFFLMYCPRWLFLIPGFLLLAAGLIGYGIAMPGLTLLGATFDAHTLLFASLAILLGYQSIFFALFTKTFAISEGLLPADSRLTKFFRVVTLERGLIFGTGAFLVGVLLLFAAVDQWRLAAFGHLDYGHTMRWVIPGVTLTALGFETILGSFFLSILRMSRR